MGKKKAVEVVPVKATKEEVQRLYEQQEGQLNLEDSLNKQCKEPLNFSLKVRLLVTDEQKELLAKIIEESRQIQNMYMTSLSADLALMEESEEYIRNKSIMDNKEMSRTERAEARKNIYKLREQYGFSKYGLPSGYSDFLTTIKPSPYMDKAWFRSMAKRCWSSVEQYFKGKGKELYTQSRDQYHSYQQSDFEKRSAYDPISQSVILGSIVSKAVEIDDSGATCYRTRRKVKAEEKCLIVPYKLNKEAIAEQLEYYRNFNWTKEWEQKRIACINPKTGCGMLKTEQVYLKLDVEGNDYAQRCLLQDFTCYTISHAGRGSKRRYFISLGIKGYVPYKFSDNGEIKHIATSTGTVGVHIDKYGVFACDGKYLYYYPMGRLANSEAHIKKSQRLDRELDRIRRELNPNNFLENGVTKKKEDCEPWINNAEYYKLREQKARHAEKRANIRKREHWDIANQIIKLGDKFIIIDTDYTSGSSFNAGRFAYTEKKRNKVIMDCAPADFESKLLWKIKQNGLTAVPVDCTKVNVLEYHHMHNELDEKLALENFVKVGEDTIYHGAYVAFLLAHVISELPEAGSKLYKKKRPDAITPDFSMDALEEDTRVFVKAYKSLVQGRKFTEIEGDTYAV